MEKKIRKYIMKHRKIEEKHRRIIHEKLEK